MADWITERPAHTSGMAASSSAWASPRLELRPVPWDTVKAIVDGCRLADWADDFPATGDVVIARLLHRAGPRPSPRDEHSDLWGHYHVIERSSGLVIGGIGFFGPPSSDGEAEIGYGIVPSRRGVGYATEGVVALVAAAWTYPGVARVVANTDADNIASQRVLEKAGFHLVDQAGGGWYRIERPS